MANPSTILNHPRRAEIDDAIADGWPNRRIAATFGVSKDAARRYRSGATRCAPAVADRPSPPAQIPPAGPSPQGPAAPHTAPGDPFDILDAHYPWAPGEIPQPDPLAQQLRYTQRQHGTAAVRDAALAVIAQHQHTGLTDTVLARKMDVPPSLVVRWRVEQEKEQLARLSREPRSILARELAAIDQRERLAWQQLSTTNVGGRTWVAAQSTLNVLFRQRMELLKASGVSLELPEPAGRSTTPLTDRGMRMADMLKSSIAEVCVAAGADANQTLDQGLDYLSQLCAAPPTGNSDLD